MMKRKIAVMMTLTICLILPSSAFSGDSIDTVHAYVDRVLEVLRDPSLNGSESANEVKREKIRAIADEMFDFAELSKRTLAKNWSKFDANQQKEFVKLFKSFLADVYADKLLSYTNEKIVFGQEIPLTEKTVEVTSTVLGKTSDIPINYRVMLETDGWKVYDVVIEGVSLVNNYRTQFREMLSNKPPESLIETLRKKVAKG
jgi:phospholipid transport system substrate-binding protein